MSNELPYGLVNVPLFQKVKAKILEEPLRFDMGEWGLKIPEGHLWPYIVGGKDIMGRPPCGTVACIAGWASATHHLETGGSLQGWHCNSSKIMEEARLLLGIPAQFRDNVFHICDWPDQFRHRYRFAKTHTEQVQTAADYIDWICGLYQGGGYAPHQGDL